MLFALIIGVVGFAGGLYLAGRFAPPLAPTRTGRTAARVVDIVVGVAVATFALSLTWVIDNGKNNAFADWNGTVSVATSLGNALWAPGFLLAAAAAVHLLAPGADED